MGNRWNELEWDDEPVGWSYSSRQRRWNRAWNNYAAIMLGLVGLILALPAITVFSWVRVAGTVCVLASSGAVVLADRAARRSLRGELLWSAAVVVLAVGGVLVFASS